jgi:hypothetical protein
MSWTGDPLPDPAAEGERAARADVALAKQLGLAIRRNGQLVTALREIAAKQKMDAVAAASMRAIAHAALNATVEDE